MDFAKNYTCAQNGYRSAEAVTLHTMVVSFPKGMPEHQSIGGVWRTLSQCYNCVRCAAETHTKGERYLPWGQVHPLPDSFINIPVQESHHLPTGCSTWGGLWGQGQVGLSGSRAWERSLRWPRCQCQPLRKQCCDTGQGRDSECRGLLCLVAAYQWLSRAIHLFVQRWLQDG